MSAWTLPQPNEERLRHEHFDTSVLDANYFYRIKDWSRLATASNTLSRNSPAAVALVGANPASAQKHPSKSLTAITRGWRGTQRYRLVKRRRPYRLTGMAA